MTVTSQTKKISAPGNGSSFVFSFDPMVIYQASDLVVVHVDATGAETTLSVGTGSSNYAINITSYPTRGTTGSITYPADSSTPMPSTERLVMKVVLTIEQQTRLANQGGYHPDVVEAALDKLTRMILQQQELVERAVLFPVSLTGVDNEATGAGANKYLKINSSATGLEWATLSVTSAGASDDTPQAISLSAANAGTDASFSRSDHVHLLPTVTVAKGGTGSTTEAGARTALDLEVARSLALYNFASF